MLHNKNKQKNGNGEKKAIFLEGWVMLISLRRYDTPQQEDGVIEEQIEVW